VELNNLNIISDNKNRLLKSDNDLQNTNLKKSKKRTNENKN
jgi:hypothetical protein